MLTRRLFSTKERKNVLHTVGVGVFQDSWHSLVNFYAASFIGLSGFNVTAPIALQSWTSPDQRSGFLALAFSYTALLFFNISASKPSWRSLGVTNLIRLCLCSVLYQVTKLCTQSRTSLKSVKPWDGQSGRYFNVLNVDSEKGLSLLTLGLLYDGVTPNSSILTFIVTALIGAPLSECNTNGLRPVFSRQQVRSSSYPALIPHSFSCTS